MCPLDRYLAPEIQGQVRMGSRQSSRIGPRGELTIYCLHGLIALVVLTYAFVRFVMRVSDGNDLGSTESINLMVVALGATVWIAEIANAIRRSIKESRQGNDIHERHTRRSMEGD